jgi:predicted O-linked N-acetylglucosamine transferase (SPINDLY family)
LEEYEALALQLAANPQKLEAIREKLQTNRHDCALFDTARFTRNLEAAYAVIWERSQHGLAAESFAVPGGLA